MTTPAGWYPDPSGSGQQRYFDGGRWLSAPPLAQQSAERRFTVHYGFAVIATLSLIGTLGPGLFIMFASVGGAGADKDGHAAAGVGVSMGIAWIVWGAFWTLIWTAFAIQHTLRSRRQH